ncbi:MAG TPA: ComEC/Rec2 family competence protein [Actinomycetes bacterium]|nr:ComEC/Rec2 family competence protein [Actinomycetes bacterium]
MSPPQVPPARDHDPDGVALAAAVAAGTLAGTRLVLPVPALLAAAALAVAVLLGCGRPRALRDGTLVLVMLALGAAGAAGARVQAVRAGLLAGAAGRGGVVTVQGTVTQEPRRLRFGGRAVQLAVTRVVVDGRAWRTRERASLVLPARIGPVAAGERLRLRAGVQPARRADALGWVPPVQLRRPVLIGRAPPRSRLLAASERLRAAARRRALDSLPLERAGLLLGLSLGDTSVLPGDAEAALSAAGLSHLTAVSGANVAVVVTAGLGLVTLAGARRPLVAAVGVALVAGFVLLTRWEPSVLRAGVMAALVLAGLALGREPGGRRALCLAVVVLLLVDPALAASLGFLLSVAATAGVLWAGPAASGLLPAWLPYVLRQALAATAGAQVAAVPVLALGTGELAPAGLPANLAALPVAAAPMLLGVVAAVAAPFAPPVSALACRLADPFLAALLAVAGWARSAAGTWILPGPARALPTLVAVAVVVAGRSAARRRERRTLVRPDA